jgi:antitoxin MazE
MKTKIQKWGNSLAVRLPKSVVEQKSLTEGEGVSVAIKDGVITIEQIKKPKYTLDELLAQITPDNIHKEIDWGSDVGKEIIP